jgi:hypothetical protein
MRAYLDKLRTSSDEANRRREEAKSKTKGADPRVLCDTPLTEQIEALMRTLSPAQRNREWSMEEWLVRLQGRYSARPHPMNVGQALRALGWKQRRDWTHEGGGRRIWLLPI